MITEQEFRSDLEALSPERLLDAATDACVNYAELVDACETLIEQLECGTIVPPHYRDVVLKLCRKVGYFNGDPPPA